MSKKKVTKSKPAAKAKPKAKSKPAAKKATAKPKVKPAAKAKKPAAKKVVSKKVKPAAKPKVKPVAKKVVKAKSKAVKKVVVKTKPKSVKKVVAKAKPVVKKVAPKPISKKEKIVIENKPAPAPMHKPATPVTIGKMPYNRDEGRKIIRPKTAPVDPNKTRYSDKELEEFRIIIINKLEEAKKELVNLQSQMTNANENGTDDTANTFKMLEDGSDSLAKEEAGQLASRQRKFVEQLENALVRIENKTYGICRVTGKLIPKERLRAVPHTTQSIEAKLNQYRD